MAIFPLSEKHRKYALRTLAVTIILSSAAIIALPDKTEHIKPRNIEQKLPPVSWSSSTRTAYWAQEAVQPGDSLGDVLTRLGIARDDIAQITGKYGGATDMRYLRADQSVHVLVGSDGSAREVQFFTDEEGERNFVALEKKGGTWRRSGSEADMKVLPTLRSVVVKTSARGALARAEVPVEIRESLSGIFAGRFNLADLQEGDIVRLLYDSLYFHGQQMATGDILAAEVVKGGTSYQAFYYRSGSKGSEGGNYYDQDGTVVQQKTGFNIEPLVYTRISSPFGYRMHPTLHTWRLHTGIDYAAPSGTPVKASADGIITFKGWKGGYGNAVMIQHANGIETLYAHLSAFSQAQGNVRSGEVIGFVGSTGRSTGPHLHYEARINGQPVNPASVALPTPELTQADKAKFARQKQEADALLASIRGIPVAVSQTD